MSDSGKISQITFLFITIYALDYFVFEIPFWLFCIVATLAVATLDVSQSEHDLKMLEKQVKNSN